LACCVDPDKKPLPGRFFASVEKFVMHAARMIDYIRRHGDGETGDAVYAAMANQLKWDSGLGILGAIRPEDLSKQVERANKNPSAVVLLQAIADDTLEMIRNLIRQRAQQRGLLPSTARLKLSQLFDANTAPLIRDIALHLISISEGLRPWEPGVLAHAYSEAQKDFSPRPHVLGTLG
jgi:hypothetical protein